MACNDILGRWIESLLVVDTTDDVLVDPPMTIFLNAEGKRRVKFTGDHADFEVTCDDTTPKTLIEFTRTHNDQVTTKYSGRVVPFGSRGTGIIRGRFTRTTPQALAEERRVAAVTNGDWETEKPT
jgi:hypothetical protein